MISNNDKKILNYLAFTGEAESYNRFWWIGANIKLGILYQKYGKEHVLRYLRNTHEMTYRLFMEITFRDSRTMAEIAPQVG